MSDKSLCLLGHPKDQVCLSCQRILRRLSSLALVPPRSIIGWPLNAQLVLRTASNFCKGGVNCVTVTVRRINSRHPLQIHGRKTQEKKEKRAL
ncbi:hypothetical protein SODALDRAFT_154356 [Sodiomyces alkalinus F11]|uniref:Uncharacterized protein n=1 Tax=Sodiomyces alkalinus (strain CBS 110278 / VKM F-3762 / F11) TaxID=1314773 RepID=A0A3N2PXF4_SODAK|nr:hypothetical protein SODALDRAFT_154356 [Sodiomyces alkalinus F11]ROT39209.1 hypothetical protein SODALDRAFT_154356 [Sodiomyces alkalinus F11]